MPNEYLPRPVNLLEEWDRHRELNAINLTLATYDPEDQATNEGESAPTYPVKIVRETGAIRIICGEAPGLVYLGAPNIVIERQKDKWLLMIHTDSGDPLAVVDIADNGRAELRTCINTEGNYVVEQVVAVNNPHGLD